MSFLIYKIFFHFCYEKIRYGMELKNKLFKLLSLSLFPARYSFFECLATLSNDGTIHTSRSQLHFDVYWE